MIAQHLIRQHHTESLDHLHAAGQLAVDTVSRLTELSLRHLRGSASIHGTRAHAVTAGEQPTPVDVDAAMSTLKASMHVLTESYAQWVKLVEAQLQLVQRTTHATLEDLQRWTPAGTEFTVEAAEWMADAAESAAELVADTSVAVVESVDAQAAPAPRRTRRTTAQKAG
ncbi:MAG: hypothetical protein DWQ11_17580 [Proteobacteria bacterium]|nr:MAG: hypothetical protein DWQ11_17580 [Pseudomonadota bacterium]